MNEYEILLEHYKKYPNLNTCTLSNNQQIGLHHFVDNYSIVTHLKIHLGLIESRPYQVDLDADGNGYWFYLEEEEEEEKVLMFGIRYGIGGVK